MTNFFKLRTRGAMALAMTLALVGTFTAGAVPAQASSDKVGICHATGSGRYIPLDVAKDAAAGGHAGLLHQEGADIIPGFTWIQAGKRYYFDGQNLDKLDLLAAGCIVSETVTVKANPPVYHPAACTDPSKPFGYVTVPADLGTGVASATEPALNPANTAWSVTYTKAANTREATYVWDKGSTGVYSFEVKPLSADPAYVFDTKTGKGQCEMPDTGASPELVKFAGIGGGIILLGTLALAGSAILRRRANRG